MPSSSSSRSSYLAVLFFGCAILVVSTGVRSSFGLFLPEMTQARGWSRETFSLAIALQNLMWGLGGSFLGAMAQANADQGVEGIAASDFATMEALGKRVAEVTRRHKVGSAELAQAA